MTGFVRVQRSEWVRGRVLFTFLALAASALALTVGVSPARAASGHVYVTNSLADTVSVVDPATNTVTATIQVGQNPRGVAVSPDGTIAYVINGFADTVSVIDTATTPSPPPSRGLLRGHRGCLHS